MVWHYACEDADTTFRLFGVLSKELEIRGLQSQFESRTMTLALQLGSWEFEGIPVGEQRLHALRTGASKQVDTAREAVQSHLGKGFNVDSNQEIQAALLADENIADFFRGKRLTNNLLEDLSGASEAARALVIYRREKYVLQQIEELIEQSQNGKVHPVFSQISSRFGQITARKPNLFATNVVREAVDKSVWHLYSDAMRSLQALVTLSGDEILSTDLIEGYPADFAILEENVDRFLLSLVVGNSNSKLARQFLLEQPVVADLRHRISVRYRRAFQWVDGVHTDAIKYGFIENEGRRFFVAGLGSSDLYKRQQAMNLCVKWLLQY
ncbi:MULTISPECIES: DNA polymerase [Thiorhodovibrio]|uniref:DNA polymerase n=1 Tax=Thiorhodovibrio TaxID=61593 RepID=UPI001912EC47|nr:MULTISPECIES: DNA polymerase [Thiorhodovibrio]MBK5970871.1 hypothetical protein [Thiorhodovibrio winogradskyi]WPL10736.1 DNA polymerase I [Thiorhodovibrio litoralis]